jgi:hypothetical protein
VDSNSVVELRNQLWADYEVDEGRFRALFSFGTRFFLGVGLGDSGYVFQRGAVLVDDEKAGCLCVVVND